MAKVGKYTSPMDRMGKLLVKPAWLSQDKVKKIFGDQRIGPLPETKIAPANVLSIGEGLYSGAMFVLGRLCMLSRDADLFHYFMWDEQFRIYT